MIRRILIVCCFLLLTGRAWAQDESSARLEEINQEIDDESKALEEVEIREAELKDKLKEVQGRIKEIKRQAEDLGAEQARLRADQNRLKGELEASEAQGKKIRETAMRRLRVLYMRHNRSFFDSVLTISDGNDLSRNAFLLTKVKGFDEKIIGQLNELQNELGAQEREIRKVIERYEKNQQKITQQQQELSKHLSSLESLAKTMREEKARHEEVVTRLRAHALRLETVVKGLTGEEEELPDRQKEPQEPTPSSEIPGVFTGDGLKADSEMHVPVSGSVVQRFGRQQRGSISDMVMHKGTEFAASEGSAVEAISAARVIFVGRMPVYGMIVILDHGKRDYSLYGRLTDIEVKVGELVTAGQKLAHCGPLDEKGRNFYFELRHSGTPVDPDKFFRGKFK